jgi:hypothetical protein
VSDNVEVNTTPGPGGNGLNLRVGTKQLGLTGPVVIPSLCILLIGVIGWIRSGDFKESFASINTHIQRLYERQDTHRAELQALILTQFDQTRSQIRAQEERFNAQEKELLEALRSNKETTGDKLEEQNQHLRSQTEEMRKQHAIQIWNQGHPPEQHLSLDLPVPPSERHR